MLTTLGERARATARHRIGMIFQPFALLHRRSVRANVALPLEIACVPASEIARRTTELLERVRLASVSSTPWSS